MKAKKNYPGLLILCEVAIWLILITTLIFSCSITKTASIKDETDCLYTGPNYKSPKIVEVAEFELNNEE